MSEQTPSPEDTGGAPGNARSNDEPGGGAAPASPVGTQPGFGPESGYGTQPGYGTSPGYPAAPLPYGTPGYAQPGPDGAYPPPPPRSRVRMWFGIIGGIVVLALVIAGVSAYLLQKPKMWVVSAPPTVAGMHRDTTSIDQQSFSSAVAKFRSDVTSLPNYGHLSSTVSAIYTDGLSRAVGFVGFNGTFKVQVVLKSANGLKVTSVPPGPHGGTAECGVSSAETICQWATSSTVGIVVIIPTGSAVNTEQATAAGKLMLQVRDEVEKPAH